MTTPDPTPNTDDVDALILEERHALWREGKLAWKLDATQRRLYEEIRACPTGEFDTEGARKLGKSYVHGVICLEAALANPGKRVNWAAITGKESRGVLLPILEDISKDAPPECAGRHDTQENRWLLPNDALIQLIGADTKKDCEKGRGPSSILNVVDEAGFHEHLPYLVDSILKPQMRRVKRVTGTFVGMTLLVSTTPYTPAHPFCVMADAASVRGAYMRLTIWDSGWETKEQIEAYIASKAAEKNMPVAEFMATTHFRREYLSERVVDEEIVVFPEMHAKRAVVVRDWPRPMGFDRYIFKRVALDLGGMRDKYGWVYGYVDFQNAKLIIEDEELLAKPNTEQVAAEFVEHEARLWPDNVDPNRISRVIDDDTQRMIRDLWDIHKVRATPAVKQGPTGGRAAAIGMIRTYLQAESLIIHPRCEQLIAQLLTATRNKLGTDFERTTDGHFDLCAALMYWCRTAPISVNPLPADFNVLTGREKPAHHPLVMRKKAMGEPEGGLVAALSKGRFTSTRRR